VRYKPILLFIFFFSALNVVTGCYLNPKKCYLGPKQPRQNLAFILQTEYIESHPVFILDPTGKTGDEIRVDDLGVTVLPGTYTFRAKLYGYHERRRVRLVDVTLDPGHSNFTLPRTVLQKVRDKEPYKITGDTSFAVKAGFKYGVWCTDDGKINNKTLGPCK